MQDVLQQEECESVYTEEDVAAKLKINWQTVRRYQKSIPGFPQPFKIGSLVRYRKADVDQFIRNHGR